MTNLNAPELREPFNPRGKTTARLAVVAALAAGAAGTAAAECAENPHYQVTNGVMAEKSSSNYLICAPRNEAAIATEANRLAQSFVDNPNLATAVLDLTGLPENVPVDLKVVEATLDTAFAKASQASQKKEAERRQPGQVEIRVIDTREDYKHMVTIKKSENGLYEIILIGAALGALGAGYFGYGALRRKNETPEQKRVRLAAEAKKRAEEQAAKDKKESGKAERAKKIQDVFGKVKALKNSGVNDTTRAALNGIKGELRSIGATKIFGDGDLKQAHAIVAEIEVELRKYENLKVANELLTDATALKTKSDNGETITPAEVAALRRRHDRFDRKQLKKEKLDDMLGLLDRVLARIETLEKKLNKTEGKEADQKVLDGIKIEDIAAKPGNTLMLTMPNGVTANNLRFSGDDKDNPVVLDGGKYVVSDGAKSGTHVFWVNLAKGKATRDNVPFKLIVHDGKAAEKLSSDTTALQLEIKPELSVGELRSIADRLSVLKGRYERLDFGRDTYSPIVIRNRIGAIQEALEGQKRARSEKLWTEARDLEVQAMDTTAARARLTVLRAEWQRLIDIDGNTNQSLALADENFRLAEGVISRKEGAVAGESGGSAESPLNKLEFLNRVEGRPGESVNMLINQSDSSICVAGIDNKNFEIYSAFVYIKQDAAPGEYPVTLTVTPADGTDNARRDITLIVVVLPRGDEQALDFDLGVSSDNGTATDVPPADDEFTSLDFDLDIGDTDTAGRTVTPSSVRETADTKLEVDPMLAATSVNALSGDSDHFLSQFKVNLLLEDGSMTIGALLGKDSEGLSAIVGKENMPALIAAVSEIGYTMGVNGRWEKN